MLQRLVDAALARRWVTAALAMLMVVAGTWSFLTLPIDAFPEIAPTQVKLILKAPGMTPEEVEARVITPIEQQMLGMPDQQVLRSVAKYAIADITISFSDRADIYWARAQVAERFAAVAAELPPGVSGGLAPISTPLSDMFMFTLDGPQSLAERRRVLDYVIRPALRTVVGVADVNVLGGRVETFEVAPDMAAMRAAGIDLETLRAAVEAGNRNDGAGRAAAGESTLIVRAVGAVQTLDDLGATVISLTPTGPVRVRDVAALRLGSLARYGAVTANGQGETVQAVVIGLRGSNAEAVVRGIKVRLAELRPTLPAGMEVGVFYDRSELIGHAVSTVEKALLEAAVLVIILLLLFLGDWRAALVVTAALPMAALITFIVMRGFGLSANLMSLGGLAIAIGLLVDGAVVVVENIVERLGEPGADNRRDRVARATGEVIQPVASGILIIILVFLPLLSLQGLEGKLFAPVAVTIVLALGASLLLALTLIPVLAEVALKGGAHAEPWLMRKLNPGYARVLEAARRRPQLVVGVAVVALVAAGFAYTRVGKIFLPTLDEGTVLVQLAKHPSVGLDHSIAGDVAVQKTVLAAVPEVKEAVARLGTDELGLDPMSLNETDMFLTLKPRTEWQVADKAALSDRLRAALARHPGIEPSFTQPIEMRVSEMLTGSRGDLAVKIFGPDTGELARLATAVALQLRATPGATEVITVADDTVDYLQFAIDREAAGRAGLTVTQVQDVLRAQLEGLPAGHVTQGLRRVPVMINSGGSAQADGAAALAETPLMGSEGQRVRASDVAMVAHVAGPVKLEHENGSRFALVQAFVSGRDIVGYVEEAQSRMAGVTLPPGYRLVWGGQFENQQRAADRLMLVLPAALILIFVLLVLTFRALRPAVLILLMIPFALVGGMLALWASGEYLSVPASVGFIALLGIAVLNGLVMVSFIRQLRSQGLALAEAVDQGARRRLRPVLMTASIAAFGLVPLLFATGPGSEIQRPLAIVVIGGLVSATLLTLVLLPLLYARFGEAEAA
jgi:cobalt-zinc-cadmium resistance protein CzcA